MDADQQPAFFKPNGKRVLDSPERPTFTRSASAVLAEQMTELEIRPETNECGWDGERIYYDLIVDGLLSQQPRDHE